ncbi:triose-phosphate isomerase [Vibrio sinensis]|uniref:Triose-phosphate isomerase n=1 Tax=Vibrio sinensis TaxID=2302434 RepID=A0A3A6QMI9_9VIBR|nr:triose-phosphate isomerase [Vibrio sinensis]RJX69375.1 triose-phosphate isomerase [Vibrio sinensis]
MNKIRAPFFTVNPKSYLYGDELLKVAKAADQLAEQYDIDIFFTAQHVDLFRIKSATKNLIVTAQHMDAISPGRGMGRILPDALAAAGTQAVFLNHAENPLTSHQLTKAVQKAKQLGLYSIVCADTLEEATFIATLHPDIMVCEPTELIGTGQTSDENYITATQYAINAISPNTLVLQAAGISTAKDVEYVIQNGAHGTGATSGIFAAPDPIIAMTEMIEALVKSRSLIS